MGLVLDCANRIGKYSRAIRNVVNILFGLIESNRSLKFSRMCWFAYG